MTHIGEPIAEFLPSIPPAVFAPDGKQFVITTHRGNLADNTVIYRLLLFQEAHGIESGRPVTLLSVASRSNAPGVQHVHWTSDGSALLFVGEAGDGIAQVFSLDVRSRVLRQLTRHVTDVMDFDTGGDPATLIFVARPRQLPVLDAETRNHGLIISNQWLPELIADRKSSNPFLEPAEVLVLRSGRASPERVRLPARAQPRGEVSLAPDGRHAILSASIDEAVAPPTWRYAESFMGWENIPVFVVADLQTGTTHLLLNAPAAAPGGIRFAWLNTSRSVVVSTYLPLDVADSAERQARRAAPYSAEVDVTDGRIAKLLRGYCELVDWDPSTSSAQLVPRQDPAESLPLVPGTECAAQSAAFRKVGGEWHREESSDSAAGRPFAVRVLQNMNTPPVLIAVDRQTGRRRPMWDPNPQFAHLKFAHVEEIAFEGTDGTKYRGGLYLPPDMASGRRYPLVIQTHGWNPERFEIDGESSAGYAAQALAGCGIVVVQLPEAPELTTEKEGPQNMAEYEGVVGHLRDLGLVDPLRVGIQAWSRTGYSVRYSLAFSTQPYAAALVVDGMEAGYLQDMLSANVDDGDVTFESLNGGKPFGATLDHWRAHSPMFNLDRVHAPVLQYMLGPDSFMNMWESFVGLKQLHKPVEMIWLPDSNHWPIRPVERLAVQQGAVDWFRFWLQDYEDGGQEKRAQYARWRVLRGLQHSSSADKSH